MTPCSAVDASVTPPGSKSITNRAIVCAALASGTSRLSGVLDSEDTQVMIAAWQQLGLKLVHDVAGCILEIEGCGGHIPLRHAELQLANSGTSIRFLTAALAACGGSYVLDGVPRMRERPIGDLLRALEQLGCTVRSLNTSLPDCPPVAINTVASDPVTGDSVVGLSSGMRGGTATVAGNISSQYLSALMMAAPLAQQDVRLEVDGHLVSVPYVAMTAAVMHSFGVDVVGPPGGPLEITASRPGRNAGYRAAQYTIEPDASAASYFWGAAAISQGRARVEGLNRASLQGDVRFCEVLEQMGCTVTYHADSIEVCGGDLRGVDVDMGHISDTVQTLAAVALFAKGKTTVRGVAHNRVKETDRISDLAHELKKFGARVEEFEDGLSIDPPAVIQAAEIETYHDHRMAMSLALVGLRTHGVVILDPACTAKTYPNYWHDLALFSRCGVEHMD